MPQIPTNELNCVAIVPSKGESQRILHKNKQIVGEYPLYEHAVRCADKTGVFDMIYISTDDTQIRDNVVQNLNAIPFIHPKILLGEFSSVDCVVWDILVKIDYRADSFCVLLPTSPLRTPKLVRDMYHEFCLTKCDCMMSFSPNGGKHDGTAIFCDTLAFLKYRDFWRIPNMSPYYIPEKYSLDIDVPDDLTEARERYGTRKG